MEHLASDEAHLEMKGKQYVKIPVVSAFFKGSSFQKGDLTCTYFLLNVNHFGKLGGFDAILARIAAQPAVSLSILKMLIRPLLNVLHTCIICDFSRSKPM